MRAVTIFAASIAVLVFASAVTVRFVSGQTNEGTPIPLENPKIPPDRVIAPGPLTMIQERSSSATPPDGLVPVSQKSSDSDSPHQRFLSNKQFMLGLINEERRKAGVPEVSLGDNNAAQIHAENAIRDCISGHWGTDGLSLSMRYSLAGSYQWGAENASGYDYCLTEEERPSYRPIQSIQSELREHMDGYMNSTGHANNILDPWHRKVNLGLVWDTHQMWTVQYFEGDYVDCSVAPTIEGTTLRVSCTVKEVFPSNALPQQFFYDPPPHALTRGQITRGSSYGLTKIVALLREQAGEGYYWPTDEEEATHYSGCTPYDVDPSEPPPSSPDEATSLHNAAKLCERSEETVTIPWITGEETISGRAFTLSHDIESVLTEHGTGVYTLLVWGCSVADSRDNPCEDDNSIPILLQSIFYGIDPPDTYSPAQASDSTPTPTATPTPTPTPSATPTPTPTPTPTATPTPTPTPQPGDCGSAVTDTSNTGLVSDCEILLDLKDTLQGSASLNWSASVPITRWTGVKLGGTPRRVTIVRLQKQSLTGSIPPEIGSLDKLQDLWLYSNELTGPLPAELGNLSDLETLMLSHNDLSGQIPLTLNNLSLKRLWLKGNNFTGCMPANLLNVPDGDAASLNLPACEGGATTPTPTPTPTPDEDDLTTLLAEGHCTQADLSEALGGDYTRTDFAPFVKYDVNGWGLYAFAKSQWVKDNDSDKYVYCLTVLYDNVSSAVLDVSYDRMKRLVEGSLDVLGQSKASQLPEIGHRFMALHIQLGNADVDGDRWIRENELDAVPIGGKTVSLLRRGALVVVVSESSFGPEYADRRPPSVDGVVEISQRIDARLIELADTSDIGAESLSAEGFSGSGFFDIAPTR